MQCTTVELRERKPIVRPYKYNTQVMTKTIYNVDTTVMRLKIGVRIVLKAAQSFSLSGSVLSPS